MYLDLSNPIEPTVKSVKAAYEKTQRVLAGVPAHAKKAEVIAPNGDVIGSAYYHEPSQLDKYA